jgi:hypothetical protein
VRVAQNPTEIGGLVQGALKEIGVL